MMTSYWDIIEHCSRGNNPRVIISIVDLNACLERAAKHIQPVIDFTHARHSSGLHFRRADEVPSIVDCVVVFWFDIFKIIDPVAHTRIRMIEFML